MPDRGLRAWLAYSNLFADIGEEVERAAGGGVSQQTEKFESAVIGFLLMQTSLGPFMFSDAGFRSTAWDWRDRLYRSKRGLFTPTHRHHRLPQQEQNSGGVCATNRRPSHRCSELFRSAAATRRLSRSVA